MGRIRGDTMSYFEITFKDKNPVKRWLQRRRLASAVRICQSLPQPPASLCDFGAGNGELCKHLAERFRAARISCYEPTPNLLVEARQNLSGIDHVAFYADVQGLESAQFDVVLCLEVFEHLPDDEIAAALGNITRVLKPGGHIVIGAPVETGLPALYKGIFRMSRRYGAFDASIGHVIRAFLGRPPKPRPVSEITPGFRYHFDHMGFDFREFEASISDHFELNKTPTGFWSVLGAAVMPEIYFVIDTTGKTMHRSF
jgi:SAM-dependent methyltransferase